MPATARQPIRDLLRRLTGRTPAAATATHARTPRKVRTAFGYHFLDTSRNRRKISTRLAKPEDSQLSDKQREQLAENARDADRNFAIAAWAIRRHLDFVATWTFHSRDKDAGLRRDLEDYLHAKEKAAAFDYTGRHPRRRWFRLAEARRIMDGDVFAVRLADGTMQAAEAEQVRTPNEPPTPWANADNWQSGVYTNAGGRPRAYAFHRQTAGTNQWELDQIVPAETVLHHAYWGGRFRQTRGISPLVAGLATLVDTYEGIDLVTARLKVDQLFALALTRNASEAPAPIREILGGTADEDTPETTETQKQYEVDFGRGPVLLDLDPGDSANFLQPTAPNPNAREFLQDLAGIALKSLDIPRSFYDEAYATFHGSRSAALIYMKAADAAREDLRDLHTAWTDWQIQRGFLNGDLLRPSRKDAVPYVWHSAGIPWWNPGVEVRANIDAIGAKLTSRQRVVAETLGVDFFDLLEELETEETAIRERFPMIGAGLAPTGPTPPAAPATPQPPPPDPPEPTP